LNAINVIAGATTTLQHLSIACILSMLSTSEYLPHGAGHTYSSIHSSAPVSSRICPISLPSLLYDAIFAHRNSPNRRTITLVSPKNDSTALQRTAVKTKQRLSRFAVHFHETHDRHIFYCVQTHNTCTQYSNYIRLSAEYNRQTFCFKNGISKL